MCLIHAFINLVEQIRENLIKYETHSPIIISETSIQIIMCKYTNVHETNI